MSSHKNDFWGNVYHMCNFELNDDKLCAFACKRNRKSPFVQDRERHKCCLQVGEHGTQGYILQCSRGRSELSSPCSCSACPLWVSTRAKKSIRESEGSMNLLVMAQRGYTVMHKLKEVGGSRAFPQCSFTRNTEKGKTWNQVCQLPLFKPLNTPLCTDTFFFMWEPLSLKCLLQIPKYPANSLLEAHLNISCSFKTPKLF